MLQVFVVDSWKISTKKRLNSSAELRRINTCNAYEPQNTEQEIFLEKRMNIVILFPNLLRYTY